MESDQGKLFIGGISWETDENLLREYFSNFGEVSQVTVMRDKATGRPRGFGFVAFSDPAVIDRVLQDKHHIDNRDVDVKRAMSRDEQSPAGRQGSFNGNNRSFDSGGGGVNVRTKKIFVGGLPPGLTADEFRAYFESYGPVSDAVIMIDQATQRPRGFGFVSFDSEESVDLVLHKTFHDLSGKQVEVKRALPKDANPGVTGGGGGGRGSGGFPGYGGSGYESRVDNNRYMQPQNAGSGYPPYGGAASGYGTTGYGYGSNGVGYGGFGGYGNPSGAPPPYGNPAAPGAGFGSGPRPSWEGQAPSGYGNNVGYGNAAVAAGAPWGGSGPGSAVMGQGGASAGYGSQGYGYGGNDSSYGAQSGYGAVGGRPNSHVGGYADVSDGSGGYGNHQVNGQAGYGGGYGRQAQQQ